MKNARWTTGRKGFSLLEAVVALLVVGIAAIASLEALSSELRGHFLAQRQLEAEALAEHQMAMIKMLYYEDFQSFPDSLAHGTFEEPFDRYKWTTDVDAVYAEENLYAVNLQVTWDGGNYDLKTMMYRRPQTLVQAAGGNNQGGNNQGGNNQGGNNQGGNNNQGRGRGGGAP